MLFLFCNHDEKLTIFPQPEGDIKRVNDSEKIIDYGGFSRHKKPHEKNKKKKYMSVNSNILSPVS